MMIIYTDPLPSYGKTEKFAWLPVHALDLHNNCHAWIWFRFYDEHNTTKAKTFSSFWI